MLGAVTALFLKVTVLISVHLSEYYLNALASGLKSVSQSIDAESLNFTNHKYPFSYIIIYFSFIHDTHNESILTSIVCVSKV